MGERKFHHLQIMRAIAAGLVVVDHSLSSTWPTHALVVSFGHRLGGAGVAIFFVISGFIMVHVSERDFGVSGSGWRFLGKRIQKIVPMYWIATILVALIIYTRGQQGSAALAIDTLRSLLFIPYLADNGIVAPVHAVGWTLNLEMLFYVTFAIFLVAPDRYIAVLGAAAILLLLVAAGQVFLYKGGIDPQTPLEFVTDPILALFVSGMLLRLLLPKFASHRVIGHSSLVFACIPLIVLLTVWLHDPLANTMLGQASLWASCLLYVALTLVFQGAGRVLDPISRMLELFGDASYSTYLAHLFALSFVKVITGPLAIQGWPQFCLFFLAAHALGLGVHLSLEAPLQRYFAASSSRSRSRLASATEAAMNGLPGASRRWRQPPSL